MEYSFFWMGECGSTTLILRFSSLHGAKCLARAIARSTDVDVYGVEVCKETEDDSVRVFGVRYIEGKFEEF